MRNSICYALSWQVSGGRKEAAAFGLLDSASTTQDARKKNNGVASDSAFCVPYKHTLSPIRIIQQCLPLLFFFCLHVRALTSQHLIQQFDFDRVHSNTFINFFSQLQYHYRPRCVQNIDGGRDINVTFYRISFDEI